MQLGQVIQLQADHGVALQHDPFQLLERARSRPLVGASAQRGHPIGTDSDGIPEDGASWTSFLRGLVARQWGWAGRQLTWG